MQGPCRIDPYGRGADRGICGLDRDAMAAAFLLRLTLQGVAEAMQFYRADDGASIAWPVPLGKKGATSMKTFGGAPLAAREIGESAVMLSRPSATPEALVRQALRLALITVALAEKDRKKGKSPGSLGFSAGYGLLAGDAITIGLAGSVPEVLIGDLVEKAAAAKKGDVRLISLGDWIPAGGDLIPIVCSTGEAETALTSGGVTLLLAGPRTDPGLLTLCANLTIPVVSSAGHPGAAAVLKQARAAFDRRTPASFTPDAALIGSGKLSLGAAEIETALRDGRSKKVALIGGADTLLQSLGHLPVELAKALRGGNHAVAAWGDAAIWTVKAGLPVGILEANRGPLAAVRVLATKGKLSSLRGICFTGLKDCREFAFALGLAALGLKVSLAVPLPLWGSEKVRAAVGKNLAAAGGSLTHFDHPAGADAILDWFLSI
jgi:hypothetical protein